jgi:2,3-bisphosphoglycerate-dependent phosphoglycerate mutase
MSRMILVRHGDSVIPGPGTEDEYTRPLTPKGFAQAEALIPQLAQFAPAAIYSSPYLRAIQTVLPFANHQGLPVQPIENFREHRMAAGPIDHWRDVLQAQWADWHYVPEGGESFKSTQDRGWQTVQQIAKTHPGGTVLLAGHGTIISLVLHRLDPKIDLDFHLAMPNPAIYEIDLSKTRH